MTLIPLWIGKMIGDAIGGANASAAHEKNIDAAMGLQRDINGRQQALYERSRQDQMPWMEAGRSSLSDLMRQMQSGGFETPYQEFRFDAGQMMNDPGYQFRLAEGQKALERSAAARGGLNSGGFMKGLANYSQGLASNEFGNAYGRAYQSHGDSWARRQNENANRFNRLSSMAGAGQNAAQYLGQLGQQHSGTLGNFANNMSSLYGARGNAQAAGAMVLPNSYGNFVNTATNAATSAMGAMAGMGGFSGMGGGGGAGAGASIPRQGASLSNYAPSAPPRYGFGLNYGGY